MSKDAVVMEAGAALSVQSKVKLYFFSNVSFARGNTIEKITHRINDDRRYINATLAAVVDEPCAEGEVLPKVALYSNTYRQRSPTLVFEDPYFIAYWPANIDSDKYSFPAELTMLEKACDIRRRLSLREKFSLKAALAKQEKMHLLRQGIGGSRDLSKEQVLLPYLDTSANFIKAISKHRAPHLQSADRLIVMGDDHLRHNECHIYANLSHVKMIAIMAKDYIFSGDQSDFSRYSRTSSGLYSGKAVNIYLSIYWT